MRGTNHEDRKVVGARLTTALSVALLVGVIVLIWAHFFARSEPYAFFDINYYRNAVIDVAKGAKSMYDALGYPPFAFLVISFLGGISVLVGNQVWTAGSILILLIVALVLSQRAIQASAGDWRQDRSGLITGTSANALLLLISMPMASQLTNGQLSLVVIALSFVDAVGVLPRRYQGVLIGVAGAIKVTPLIFVPYYLVTGQRRQAAMATGTFTAATGIAWALFPEGSAFFWTHVGKNDQFGDPSRMDNLSIHSSLARWSTDLGQTTWLWIALGLVVVIAAMWRARRHFQRGEQTEAALVVGASATVVAPIAWPHYFTWLPLGAMWLMMTGNRKARWVGIGIYFAYSMVYTVVIPTVFKSGLVVRIGVDLLVVIPVLIGLFGLPHRNPSSCLTGELDAEPEPGAPMATPER